MEGVGVTGRTNRAVFLDRDGTIIEDVDSLTRIEEMRILPGVPEALRRLREAGFLLIIVTNQSAIARGRLTESGLAVLHEELNRRLAAEGAALDAFYYCPHLPGAVEAAYDCACRCRKPAPGLLWQAAREWRVKLRRSYMVGDSDRDVEAGRRAACTTILIGSGSPVPADAAAADLGKAASIILRGAPLNRP